MGNAVSGRMKNFEVNVGAISTVNKISTYNSKYLFQMNGKVVLSMCHCIHNLIMFLFQPVCGNTHISFLINFRITRDQDTLSHKTPGKIGGISIDEIFLIVSVTPE